MANDSITQRTCPICKISYPSTPEYFHKRRASKNGLNNICKTCNKAKAKKQRESHKEEYLKYIAQYRIDNREQLKEKRLSDYITNHSKHRKLQLEYYNRTQPARVASKRKYYSENPHKVKIASSKNRIRKMNAEGTYTLADIDQIFEDQNERCAYCGITLYLNIPGDVHVDHITPLSRGGSNWPDNLALTCASCNLSKHDKTLEEWQKVRGW